MNWHTLNGFLSDEKGQPSSRRLLGFVGGLALVIYMFAYPSEAANNSVLYMTFACLGITAVGKVSDLIKPKTE